MSALSEIVRRMDGAVCPACGRVHHAQLAGFLAEAGAIRRLPEILQAYHSRKCFLLSDKNTWEAAGKAVAAVLTEADIAYSCYCFPQERPVPNEQTVGSALMHYDAACDTIIAIGTGVLNDTGKLLARATGHPYIVVGTAPSMDGFASATSSMERDGLKISLPSVCPNWVIGDTDVLKNAPERMLMAGLGDMLTKYIALTEWKIAHLLVDEFYCPEIAALMQSALDACVKNADALMRREEGAVNAVFEGLIVAGLAANFAEASRPASGVEHYFSHVWDMRGLAFGTPVDLHGIQAALGTVQSLRLYEKMAKITPNREKALAYVRHFSLKDWHKTLRGFLGKGAEAMIALEAKEGKYSPEKHAARLERILAHWPELVGWMRELPSAASMEALLRNIGAPVEVSEIGLSAEILPDSFRATKDIRDKYVLSRLCWDLGIADEMY